MGRVTLVLRAITFFSVITFLSCTQSPLDEGQSDEPIFQTDLLGYYMNSNGDNPQFTVESDSINHFVVFDGQPDLQVDTGNLLVSITLNGVSIFDDTSNHTIDTVVVKEYVNNKWTYFPEFKVDKPTLLSSISVILVLDVSNSLGNDFTKVKQYAKDFVKIIFEKSESDNSVGIIDFATDINSLPLTSDEYEIYDYIDSLRQGEYTSMYDAMKIGIEILNQENVEGKALVTFTDGRDNYSKNTANDIINSLSESGIGSYTIGLKGKGGVEVYILSELAVNGRFAVANSADDLLKIFEDFAKTIKYMYNLTYYRNNQAIGELRGIKFTFQQLDPLL